MLAIILVFSAAVAAEKKSTIFKSKTGYSIDLKDCWVPEVELNSNSEKVEESYWLGLNRKKECEPIKFESQVVDLFAISSTENKKMKWPETVSKYEYGHVSSAFHFEYKRDNVKVPFNLQITHYPKEHTRWEYGLFCPKIFILITFGFGRPMTDPKEIAKLKTGSAAIPEEIKKLIDSVECAKAK